MCRGARIDEGAFDACSCRALSMIQEIIHFVNELELALLEVSPSTRMLRARCEMRRFQRTQCGVTNPDQVSTDQG